MHRRARSVARPTSSRVILGCRRSLCSRARSCSFAPAIPYHMRAQHGVRQDALAVFAHGPEVELRRCVTLFGGHPIPAYGCRALAGTDRFRLPGLIEAASKPGKWRSIPSAFPAASGVTQTPVGETSRGPRGVRPPRKHWILADFAPIPGETRKTGHSDARRARSPSPTGPGGVVPLAPRKEFATDPVYAEDPGPAGGMTVQVLRRDEHVLTHEAGRAGHHGTSTPSRLAAGRGATQAGNPEPSQAPGLKSNRQEPNSGNSPAESRKFNDYNRSTRDSTCWPSDFAGVGRRSSSATRHVGEHPSVCSAIVSEISLAAYGATSIYKCQHKILLYIDLQNNLSYTLTRK